VTGTARPSAFQDGLKMLRGKSRDILQTTQHEEHCWLYRCLVSAFSRMNARPAGAFFRILPPENSQQHHHAIQTGHDISRCRHLCRYGSEAGLEELRESIAGAFYGDTVIKPSEIFVSDGSKCDIGRLQMMFGSQASVALQV
jgi:aspartate/methionine/tyrosine aminotransferase